MSPGRHSDLYRLKSWPPRSGSRRRSRASCVRQLVSSAPRSAASGLAGCDGSGWRARLASLCRSSACLCASPFSQFAHHGGRVGYLPANLPPLQPALLDRSGQVEIIMLGIVEELELVESLRRAAQVGQGVPPVFGDSLRVDHVTGAGKHAVLDPVNIDLRIAGAEVHPLDAVASLDDAFHDGRSGPSGAGAFRAKVQPLPDRFRDLRINVHSRSDAGLRAVPVPDAASNRVLVEVARRQQVVVLALPGTLADAIATHHDGEHRTGSISSDMPSLFIRADCQAICWVEQDSPEVERAVIAELRSVVPRPARSMTPG